MSETSRVLPDDWTLPALTDSNRAWFTSGKLLVQECSDCGATRHPPEEICHECGSLDHGHRELAPTGTVHSYTIAHYAVNRALADHVPYAVVLVSIDQQPEVRIVGNLLGVPPDAVEIGMAVRAVWLDVTNDLGEELKLLQWEPVS